jgi:hypothetical protein
MINRSRSYHDDHPHNHKSYEYHLSRSRFRATIGFDTAIANPNADTVNTSCTLLKFSLRTSKVPDGAIRVRKRSKPYANTSDVDSRRAGEVMILSIFVT